MSDAALTDCEECLTPAEAFGVVANETRLAILEALWQADERPVTFSELRRAVGMRDSAQFNYHLDRLRGQYVEKTDGGYEFRQAGRAVVQAVLAGSLNEHPELDPFEVDGECTDCGASLVARYADERLRVTCPDCDRLYARAAFPPGGLEDRTREELMAAFNQRVRHLKCLTADGVCPECGGRIETTFEADHDCLDLDVAVRHECQRCPNTTVSSVGLALLDDAETVSFYRDHGIDLNAEPFWTLEWCVSDRHTTVLASDPWKVQVEIPLDEELLRVVVDGDLRVVECERTDASTAADARSPA